MSDITVSEKLKNIKSKQSDKVARIFNIGDVVESKVRCRFCKGNLWRMIGKGFARLYRIDGSSWVEEVMRWDCADINCVSGKNLRVGF